VKSIIAIIGNVRFTIWWC